MKFFIATFLCLAVASAHPTAFLHPTAYIAEDGQYRGEGLAESQDVGQYNFHDDGQYRGEGLLESQDFGQYNPLKAVIAAPAVVAAPAVYASPAHVPHVAPVAYAAHYAHAAGAPIGLDGRVVDTPEVAHAKAEHFAAKAVAGSYHGAVVAAPAVYAAPAAVVAAPAHVAHVAPVAYAAHYAHAGAPIGLDGRVVDTPEVAHAKAAHFAAKAAAGSYHY